MVKRPSKGRSGRGFETSAEARARTLVLPRRMSTRPYSSPNSILRGRKESKWRPSIRRLSFRASRMKVFSLMLSSASRGGIVCFCF